jgi:LDH2 family malate/lactate/ureidoglycolate dehydrogenase
MVEILCSVLSGGAMANEVGGIRIRGRQNRCSQCFIAIDIARFMPVEEFTARVEQLVHLMKSTPPRPATTRCWWPAIPEWRTEAERLRTGIPIEQGNWDLLVKTAARLEVALPTIP